MKKAIKKKSPKRIPAKIFKLATKLMADEFSPNHGGTCGACRAIAVARRSLCCGSHCGYESKQHHFFETVFQNEEGLCSFGFYSEENRTSRVIALALAAILMEEGFKTKDFQ